MFYVYPNKEVKRSLKISHAMVIVVSGKMLGRCGKGRRTLEYRRGLKGLYQKEQGLAKRSS